MNNCSEVLISALESSLDSFQIDQEGEYCKITSPFQHSNGDLVTVWVTRLAGNTFAVRDRGETFALLRLYGVNPDANSRTDKVEMIANQFDVSTKGGEIEATGKEANLGDLILNTIQASQAMSHLLFTHKASPSTQFDTKVDTFLNDSGYDYQAVYPVEGETDRVEFDFCINHREPTVLLDTIHSRTDPYLQQQVQRVMLHWHEIQGKSYDHAVLVDDVEAEPNRQILSRLVNNLDFYFTWSERKEILDKVPVEA